MENQLKAELRIGNALKFWNNIFFVSEITELKITAKNKSLGIICEDYIEFSPITLTEDILLRLGFEKTANPRELKYDDYSILLLDEIRFVICNYMENPPSVKVSTLHQLQNLFFSLTGEELTFKN